MVDTTGADVGASHRRVMVPQLAESLTRFVTMPPEYAAYDLPAEAAARMLRCTVEDMTDLARRGLPSAASADGLKFDHFDVLNIGRFSLSGLTVPELNALTLLRFSSKPASAWLGDKEWRVSVRLPDDEPGRYRIRVPDFSSIGVTRLDDHLDDLVTAEMEHDGGYNVSVRLTGSYDPIRSALAGEVYQELLACLRSGEVRYQGVCESLRGRPGLAWQLGMADCMVTNRVLAGRLRAAGLRARARRGFILGLVGSEHAWCEVYEDGTWKSMEVTFAAVPSGLALHGPAPAHDEFVAHCFGTRFNRCLPCVSDDAEPLVYDTAAQRRLPMIGIISARERKPSS